MLIPRRVFPLLFVLLAAGCATSSGLIPGFGQRKSQRTDAPENPPSLASRPPNEAGLRPGTQQWPLPDPGQGPAGQQRSRIDTLLAEGWQAEQNGQINLARSAYERVLTIDPQNVVAHHHLAAIADNDTRYAEAERHYLAALRVSPRDANLLTSLGWSYFLQGRFDECEAALRDALALEPNHTTALYNLGWLYGTRGDTDSALALFRKAGSEADAQRTLASLTRERGTTPPTRTEPPKGEHETSSLAAASPPANGSAAYPNEATRKIAEEMERQRAALKDRVATRGTAPERTITAPTPWRDNGNTISPPKAPQSAGANSARRREAMPPDNINGLFAAIDRTEPAHVGLPGSAREAAGMAPDGSAAWPATGQWPAAQSAEQVRGELSGQPGGQPPPARGAWSHNANPDGSQAPQPALPDGNPFEPAQALGSGQSRVTHADATAQQLARYPAIHAESRGSQKAASAQAQAAQMGLSAGAGVFIIPPADANDWPLQNGEAAAKPLTDSGRAPADRQPASSARSATGPRPSLGGPPSPGPDANIAETDRGLSLAPSRAPPGAVVPSAQAMVYGQNSVNGPVQESAQRPAVPAWPARTPVIDDGESSRRLLR